MPPTEKPWKFTMTLEPAAHEQARALEEAVVRLAGIRATRGMRGEVVRSLLALAAEDAVLQTRVAAKLRAAALPADVERERPRSPAHLESCATCGAPRAR